MSCMAAQWNTSGLDSLLPRYTLRNLKLITSPRVFYTRLNKEISLICLCRVPTAVHVRAIVWGNLAKELGTVSKVQRRQQKETYQGAEGLQTPPPPFAMNFLLLTTLNFRDGPLVLLTEQRLGMSSYVDNGATITKLN